MRRARIKAMASVPARRKPTQNIKEETSEAPKTASIEVTNDQTDSKTPEINSSTSCNENLEKSVVPTPDESTKKNNEIESKPVESTNEPKISNKSEKSEVKSPESISEKKLPSEKISQKEIFSPKKESVSLDNKQNSGTNEPKAISSNVDAPSPTKSQTRASFMRPTPRLDGGGRIRRNSVQGSGASASESEDDTRRGGITSGFSNNGKNEAINSPHSPKGRSSQININSAAGCANSSADSSTIDENSQKNATPTTTTTATSSTINLFASSAPRQKRKVVISESARKLAESRREFLLKHEHKQPDKTKLIMYDLIYYNPVTNPMKKSEASATSSKGSRPSSSVITAETEDEDEDDDDEGAEAMPVPQVKVGPDGSLVIDEQSLVIERTGARKSRQAMARTEALVDEEANGSGFYKKRPKGKEWSKIETLKFYRALNTVGTDFSFIQTLFPHRTRQEIKFKFKKEEKINPRLLEKALVNYQEYDIDTLKEELDTFEESIKEKTEVEKPKNAEGKTGRRGKRRRNLKPQLKAASAIAEIIDSPEDCNETESICGDNETQEATSRAEKIVANNKKLDINSSREDSEKTMNQPNGRQRGKKRKNLKSNRTAEINNSEINDTSNNNNPNNNSALSNSEDNEIFESTSSSSQSEKKRNKTRRLPSAEISDESGSDTEIYQIKPTRSGRLPKIRKLQAPTMDDNNSSDNDEEFGEKNDKNVDSTIFKENDESIDSKIAKKSKIHRDEDATISVDNPEWKSKNFHNSLSGISKAEPGSLIIVSQESADDPGETVLQVYMVSSDMNDGNDIKQNMTPVVLTPELLNTVTAGINKVAPLNVKPK